MSDHVLESLTALKELELTGTMPNDTFLNPGNLNIKHIYQTPCKPSRDSNFIVDSVVYSDNTCNRRAQQRCIGDSLASVTKFGTRNFQS